MRTAGVVGVLSVGLAATFLASGAVAEDGATKSSVDGAVAASAAVEPANTFQAISPCRVVDTRKDGDADQVGRLVPGDLIAYDVVGSAGAIYFRDQGAQGCNITTAAVAVELTFTAVQPVGRGFFRAFPASDGPNAGGATVLNFDDGGLSPTNSVMMAVQTGSLGTTSGELGFRSWGTPGSSTDLVIDVTGYAIP